MYSQHQLVDCNKAWVKTVGEELKEAEIMDTVKWTSMKKWEK